MIDKFDFSNAVDRYYDKFRERSFEAHMEGFVKSIIKEAISVDIPRKASYDTKKVIANTVTNTIDNIVKTVSNRANLLNEMESIYNFNLAHEIVDGADLNESIQKLLANFITDEANDRKSVLTAEYEAGKFNNLSMEELNNYIFNSYENVSFDTRFENGLLCKRAIKEILSCEGSELVENIKADVHQLVNETEAKNSIIREAVSEINEKKAEIEENINGEAETPKQDLDESGRDDSGKKVNKNGEPINKDNDSSDQSDTERFDEETPDKESSTEGFYQTAIRTNKNKTFSSKYLYEINDLHSLRELSGEDFERNFDKDSFSREAAEEILKEFRELDDGIDTDSLSDDALSTSEKIEENYENDDEKANSIEDDYNYSDYDSDSENETIVIDNSKFELNEEFEPEELSEEAIARDFYPLSLLKMRDRNIRINSNRTALWLAINGKPKNMSFYEQVKKRHVMGLEMYEKATNIDEIDKTEIESKMNATVEKCHEIDIKTQKITEDLGILGILEGKYQRTGDPVQNAVNSLFNTKVLKPKGLETSKEDLQEHELAEIFRLRLKMNEIQNDIANGVDVLGNKEYLGHIDELMNEKIYKIEDNDIHNRVDDIIKTLHSIEQLVSLKDVANFQAFKNSQSSEPTEERIVLNSLKDIDAYGYSYSDEIKTIKKNMVNKYKDKFGDVPNVNVKIEEFVELIAEEKDTTKINANLYEKTISKLIENKDIKTSTESLIIRNKAKAIITGYLTFNKLGLLSETDNQQLNNYLA